ncbi:MAG TPA: hypothetical protein VJZ71_18190 [Phycisphaerae bacterium]|nr:hypothetical protein [Phycisphaerae bacterium]
MLRGRNKLIQRCGGIPALGVLAAIGCQGLLLPGVPSDEPTPGASVLPSGLTLDISEFPDDDVAPDTAKSAAEDRVFPSEHARVCHAAGAILHGFHRLLDRGLLLAAAINDDLVAPTNPHLEGSFEVSDRVVQYKADFSAFDIDGDGTADGSGQFDTEPVAIRLWVLADDGTPSRWLCGLITTRATPDNAGAGQVFLQPGVVHPLVNPDFKVHAQWDRTNPMHKWNEAYTVGRLRVNVDASAGHHRVDVETLAENTVQKTVRSTTTIADSDFLFSELRYAGRTNRGSRVALVNTEALGTPNVLVTGLCVSLEQCEPVPGDQCGSIDPSNMDFLPASSGGATDWPADFPDNPTF